MIKNSYVLRLFQRVYEYAKGPQSRMVARFCGFLYTLFVTLFSLKWCPNGAQLS